MDTISGDNLNYAEIMHSLLKEEPRAAEIGQNKCKLDADLAFVGVNRCKAIEETHR